MNKIHFEFIKVNGSKYYCIEYIKNGDYINEGTVKKDTEPYDAIEIPIIDSLGKQTCIKKIDLFKFCKDGFWTENIDGHLYFYYESGKYKNGKKNGIWQVFKINNVEKNIFYENGVILKKEIANLTGSADKKIESILMQRWKQVNVGILPLEFIPDKDHREKYSYFQLNKNGTYVWYNRTYIKPEEGTWELNKEKTQIKITSKFVSTNYSIAYISKYGLKLTNVEYLK